MVEKYESLDDLFDDESLDIGNETEGDVPEEVRNLLALALDVDDLVDARRLAKSLKPYFGTVKIGLELYAASGPDAVGAFTENEFNVFCDLKLHDIPTTVKKTARVIGSLGARWVTAHVSGGEEMLRAAVEGLEDGAASAGLPSPGVLGVTVLTSAEVRDKNAISELCHLAVEAGCQGIVCAAPDLVLTAEFSDRLFRVVPGLRMSGGDSHDQTRIATPREAVDDGADLLVIGRMITLAKNPVEAAEDLISNLLG